MTALRLRAALLALLLLALLAPYLSAPSGGGMTALLTVVVALVVLAGALRPARTLIALLAAAPWIDGVLGGLLAGDSRAFPAGFSLVEPVFLAAAAGAVLHLLRKELPANPVPTPAGAPLYIAAVAGSLALSFWRFGADWGWRIGVFFSEAWSAIPFMRQLNPVHTLRAGLVLMAGALWMLLVSRFARGRTHPALQAWLAGSAVVIVASLLSGQAAEHSVLSFLEDRNSQASYLILTLFAAWAALLSWVGRTRLIAAVVLLGAVLALLISGSKSGLLVALMFAAGLFMAWAARRGRHVVITAAIVTVLAVPLLSAAGRRIPGRFSATIGQINSPGFMLDYLREKRLPVWSAAGGAFRRHLLVGIGPGLLYRNLGAYYPEQDAPAVAVSEISEEWRPVRENAHNYFLQLGAETGIIGLVGFLWLVGGVLLPPLLAPGPVLVPRRILAAGAAAYLATSLTGHPLLLFRQVLLFWGFLGILHAGAPTPDEVPAHARKQSIQPQKLAFVALAVVLTASFLTAGPRRHCPPPATGEMDVDLATGFYPEESAAGQTWRWMGTAAQMSICNSTTEARPMTVELDLASFHVPRRVSFARRGEVLATHDIPVAGAIVKLPVIELPPGRTGLILSTDPPAEPASVIPGNEDARRLAIQLRGNVRLTPAVKPRGGRR